MKLQKAWPNRNGSASDSVSVKLTLMGLGPRCTGVVAERRPGYSETSPCRLWINKGNGKHRPRGCGPQKSRTLLQPKTQGSFRCPPTGIHPCCNNALRSPPYLVD